MTVNDLAMTMLRELGAPEELERQAREKTGRMARPRLNAHIHLPPNFSAFESARQAALLTAEQGVQVLGASNYYDYEVYQDLAALARERGIFPLYGLEVILRIEELARENVLINDPGNPGKMYLCGKGITRFAEPTAEARRLLEKIRGGDRARMAEMIGRMAEIFAAHGVETGLDEDAVIQRVVARHGCPRERVWLQERHIGQAFQEIFFERVAAPARKEKLSEILGAPSKAAPEDHVAVQNELRSHLMKIGKPAFVDERFINFGEACRLILELGGIPCYPVLADGAKPICGFEQPVETLIERLRERRICAAEFIPNRNAPEVLTQYVTAMRAAGLAVTAGTEHNTLDLAPIEPTCAGGAPVPEAMKEIFWEGACVAAAHQFLSAHGRTGYVDAAGEPNPTYGSAEARIEAFRRLGEVVIERALNASAMA